MINLYHGDCLKIMDKLIADGVKVDAVVTDPPYDISVRKGGGSVNRVTKLKNVLKEIKDAEMSKGYDIPSFGEKCFKLMDKFNAYFWCNKKQIPEYMDYYVSHKKCKFDILCWHKTNSVPTYSNKYLSDTEYCLYFRKNGFCSPQNYKDAKTYWEAPLNKSDKKLYGHPTVKPLYMIEQLIKNSSNENQTVLDPFMGSGTTGVACRNLNRNFIGIELDFNYYMTAWERIYDARA